MFIFVYCSNQSHGTGIPGLTDEELKLSPVTADVRFLAQAFPRGCDGPNLQAEKTPHQVRHCGIISWPIHYEQQVDHGFLATRPASPWLYQTSPSMNSSRNTLRRSVSAGSTV